MSNNQLPVTNYQLPVISHQFPVTNYQLPITNYQLPITNNQFMQNKANLPDTQTNVTSAHITSYQLPVTNYQYAKQTQSNPIFGERSRGIIAKTTPPKII